MNYKDIEMGAYDDGILFISVDDDEELRRQSRKGEKYAVFYAQGTKAKMFGRKDKAQKFMKKVLTEGGKIRQPVGRFKWY